MDRRGLQLDLVEPAGAPQVKLVISLVAYPVGERMEVSEDLV
jgi:hypothetical protein